MQNNSIKSNLTKDDIVSDIRLSLGADIERNHIYVVVEGEDDIKFLKSELDDNVYLYESYDGKTGVEEIACKIFKSNIRVIGIRDKDYCNHIMSADGIFVYDNCCMEMMFIENDNSFRSVYHEYYNGKTEVSELREKLLSELRYLSYVRKLNEEESWGLIIKGVSINNAIKNKEIIDVEVLSKNIKKINNSAFDEMRDNRVRQLYLEEISTNELLEITQGHDFANLFAAICNMYKKKGVNGRQIESGLRCAYRHSDFLHTKLRKALVLYQERINITFLVA